MKYINILIILLISLKLYIQLNNGGQQLKALIIGGSGAVGRELISELCKSDNWGQITVITRRRLERWEQCEKEKKLNVILEKSLESLQDTQAWDQFKGYDSFFCLLGSQVSQGEKEFRQVDYQYPLWGAEIAKNNEIPHYSLLTSIGSNKDSYFQYLRVKGEVEDAIQKIGLKSLSIFRPGALLDRDNDFRWKEVFMRYLPFFSKISTKDVTNALKKEAEIQHQWGTVFYSHDQIVQLAKNTNSNYSNQKIDI